MESAVVSFTYESGEYARALRRVQVRRHRARFDAVIALAFLAAGAHRWMSAGFDVWVALLSGPAALLLALLAFGVFAVPWIVERDQPKLREPYRLSFSEEGIRFETPSIDSKVSWSFYRSWSEDSEFLYLFHGRRDVTIVPLRAFENVEAREAVRSLVSRRIEATRAAAR